jgi:hypothetical protein
MRGIDAHWLEKHKTCLILDNLLSCSHEYMEIFQNDSVYRLKSGFKLNHPALKKKLINHLLPPANISIL